MSKLQRILGIELVFRILFIVFLFTIDVTIYCQEKTPKEMSIEELLNVQVYTASKRDQKVAEAPATIYVITEEDIKQYGYRDLKDVLQQIPGIEYSYPQSHIEGGQRGFPGTWSQTKILINGRSTNSLWAGGVYVASQYTLNNVKQIEIIQGPASALYGAEAYTGVINIITKNSENSDIGSDFSLSLGNMDKLLDNKKFSFNTIAQNKNLGIALGGTVFSQNGPDFTDFIRSSEYTEVNRQLRNDMLDSLNPYRDDDRAYNTNVDFIYSMNDRNHIKAGIYFLRDEDGGGIENPEISYTNFNLTIEQVLTYLSYEKDFSSIPLKLAFDAFREDQYNLIRFQNRSDNDDNPPPLAVFNIEDNKLHKINLQFDFSPKIIKNYLIAGFGYREVNIGEPAFTGVSSTDSTLGKPIVGRYLYPPRGYFSHLKPYLDQNKKYAYIQDQQYLLNDRVQLTLGGRFDQHNIYGGVANLRSGLFFNLLNGLSVKALYGEAFREPTMFELSDNSELKPARMQTGEFSVHFNHKKYIAGQVVYYKSRASRIIEEQRGTTGRGGIPVNIGLKEVQGIEGLVNWQYIKLRGNIWYNYEHNPDDPDFLNVAKNKLGAGVIYNLTKKITISLQGKYTDEIKTNAFDIDGNDIVITIPEYKSINLTLLANQLEFTKFPKLDLSFSVYNLFNTKNLYPNMRGPNPSRYLAEGRSFYIRSTIYFIE